jgi:hypothetical protein
VGKKLNTQLNFFAFLRWYNPDQVQRVFLSHECVAIRDTPSGCVCLMAHGQNYATFLDNDQLIRFLVSIDVLIDF